MGFVEGEKQMNDNLIMLVKFDKETGSTSIKKSVLYDYVRSIENYSSIRETELYSIGEAVSYTTEADLPF